MTFLFSFPCLEFEDHDYQTAIQALSDYITPADMTRLCALFALTHRQTEKVRSSDTPAREFLSYLNRRGTIAPDDMTFLVEGLKEVGLVIVAQRLTTMLQEIESKEVEAESAVTVTGGKLTCQFVFYFTLCGSTGNENKKKEAGDMLSPL